MTTKDELSRQDEKRTDKKDETLDRSGIELLDKICSQTMVNWDLDKFRRTHGTLLFCIETALNSYSEAYHKGRVESISSGEFKKESTDYGKRAYSGHFAGEEPEYHYINGMKRFKSMLLK